MRIEVSTVAPAFGREGGGIQVRFIDPDGQPSYVRNLLSDEFPLLEENLPEQD